MFMVLATTNKTVLDEEPEIIIDNWDIVYKTMFLNIVIDIKLNWRAYVDYTANRIT